MSEIEPEFLKKLMQWLSLADEDLNQKHPELNPRGYAVLQKVIVKRSE